MDNNLTQSAIIPTSQDFQGAHVRPAIRKLIFPILALLVLMVGLGFSLKLLDSRQNVVIQASADKVDMMLSAPPSVALNQEVVITVSTIAPQVYKVSAIQLELIYPSDKYDFVSLVPADYLTTILKPASSSGNATTITLGSGPTAKSGTGILQGLLCEQKEAWGLLKLALDPILKWLEWIPLITLCPLPY